MIEDVNVLRNQILATVHYCWQIRSEMRSLTYLPRGLASSVGGLRGRSVRFFDMACSRNDDLFVLRRLLEKLSVCDLFGFRLNIFNCYRWSWKKSIFVHSTRLHPNRGAVKCCRNCRWDLSS